MKKHSAITIVWLLFIPAIFAGPTNRYVVKDNAGAAIPYDSQANAAADIQTAINYAYAGETVLVAAATYDTGGTEVNTLTNRVYISKAITVRSLNNDPANTIIKGAWASNGQTNGLDAIRCVYMVAGSSLIGFTLTNGATATNSAVTSGRGVTGGGVYTISCNNTFVSNCIIVGNASRGDSGNGPGGGGAANASLFNCVLRGNTCHIRGGGGAGGSWNVMLSNCTVVGNQSLTDGGGVNCGTLYGCLVASNTAPRGGGVSSWSAGLPAWAYNCTVVNNTSGNGGGVGGGNSQTSVFLYNCISWSNSSPDRYIRATNSCGVAHANNNYTNALAGNFTNNPMFVDSVAGNYHLQPSSPCVNAGTNQPWMLNAADLDGKTRVRYGTVDMGAYEKIYDGTVYNIH